ncbi:MAG: hypothetical protein MI724_06900 [Spirochaetales bacterium]|nr:hypothetical protein [Spirochaetales bacterium]
MRRSYLPVPAASKLGATFEALFVATTVALPVLSHALGWNGAVWLPMHWGVLAASMTVGPIAGLFIGLAAPPLNALLTGLPPAPIVPAMMAELAVYGCIPAVALLIMHRDERSVTGTAMVAAGALAVGQLLGRAAFLAGVLATGSTGPAAALSAAPLAFARSAFAPGLPAALAQIVVLSTAFATARHMAPDADRTH